MSTKDNWKEVGRDFKRLGIDLGKTAAKTVKKGVEAADRTVEEWIKEDEEADKKSSGE